MQEVYRTVARLMNTDLTVMITGESGTGKELVARALHDFGKRRGGPFGPDAEVEPVGERRDLRERGAADDGGRVGVAGADPLQHRLRRLAVGKRERDPPPRLPQRREKPRPRGEIR